MESTPLAGVGPVQVANWPAAVEAGRLLTALGASTESRQKELRLHDHAVDTATTAQQDWTESGIAELTGRPDGPPLTPRGQPATIARAAALALELLTQGQIAVDGARLLSQRVPYLELVRGGTTSANGSARLLRASNGWFAVNLPRPSDIELIPALVEGPIDEPWSAIADWASQRTLAEIEHRGTLLGLAIGSHRPSVANAPWRIRRITAGPPLTRAPLVVNLGSLWAAPLCAQLLAHAGAQIIDVESPDRPDGARHGTPTFYRELHHGHHLEIIDINESSGRAQLTNLIWQADIIITASRAGATSRLGLSTDTLGSEHPQIWTAIAGHDATSERIAYGDDAAVAGGLTAHDEHGPTFVGDAIADPLAGLLAALATTATLQAGGSWHLELSLRNAAAYAATSYEALRLAREG